MGIETQEGYLGHEETGISFENSALREYVKAYQINGRTIYKDMRTGRFISEKGLARKTE